MHGRQQKNSDTNKVTNKQERQQGCEPWTVAVIEHTMRLFNSDEKGEETTSERNKEKI
jgi:pseudouridine-5'-phosphate glycosidase